MKQIVRLDETRNTQNIFEEKELRLIILFFHLSQLFRTSMFRHPYVSVFLISFPHFYGIYTPSFYKTRNINAVLDILCI
jgi:hypothetical protein